MDLTPLQRDVSDRQLAGLVIKCRLWDQGSMARCGKMYAATTEKAVQDTSNPLSPYYSVIWFWQYTQLPRSSIYRLDWCTDRWFRTWLSYVHPSWCHSPHQSVCDRHPIVIQHHTLLTNFVVLLMREFDAIFSLDWMTRHKSLIDFPK